MAVWLIRCGDKGKEEHKERFFTENLVAIGYGLKVPVTDFSTLQELKDSPDMAARSGKGGDANILWRFAGRPVDDNDDGLRTGDLALTPYTEAGARMVAVGEVTGDYHFNAQDLGVRNPHWRSARWQNMDIPMDGLPVSLQQFLKYRRGLRRASRAVEKTLYQFLDNRNAPV